MSLRRVLCTVVVPKWALWNYFCLNMCRKFHCAFWTHYIGAKIRAKSLLVITELLCMAKECFITLITINRTPAHVHNILWVCSLSFPSIPKNNFRTMFEERLKFTIRLLLSKLKFSNYRRTISNTRIFDTDSGIILPIINFVITLTMSEEISKGARKFFNRT